MPCKNVERNFIHARREAFRLKHQSEDSSSDCRYHAWGVKRPRGFLSCVDFHSSSSTSIRRSCLPRVYSDAVAPPTPSGISPLEHGNFSTVSQSLFFEVGLPCSFARGDGGGGKGGGEIFPAAQAGLMWTGGREKHAGQQRVIMRKFKSRPGAKYSPRSD